MKLEFFSAAARPLNEAERQAEVDRLDLERIDDPRLHAIVAEVRALLGTPIAAISIIDGDRQLFLSRDGIAIRETPRAIAICAHGLDGDAAVRDYDRLEADRRFRSNPLVTGEPHLRAYVGAPLVTDEGLTLGALCGLDTRPRHPLDEGSAARLQVLARQVVAILAEHRHG